MTWGSENEISIVRLGPRRISLIYEWVHAETARMAEQGRSVVRSLPLNSVSTTLLDTLSSNVSCNIWPLLDTFFFTLALNYNVTGNERVFFLP